MLVIGAFYVSNSGMITIESFPSQLGRLTQMVMMGPVMYITLFTFAAWLALAAYSQLFQAIQWMRTFYKDCSAGDRAIIQEWLLKPYPKELDWTKKQQEPTRTYDDDSLSS